MNNGFLCFINFLILKIIVFPRSNGCSLLFLVKWNGGMEKKIESLKKILSLKSKLLKHILDSLTLDVKTKNTKISSYG